MRPLMNKTMELDVIWAIVASSHVSMGSNLPSFRCIWIGKEQQEIEALGAARAAGSAGTIGTGVARTAVGQAIATGCFQPCDTRLDGVERIKSSSANCVAIASAMYRASSSIP